MDSAQDGSKTVSKTFFDNWHYDIICFLVEDDCHWTALNDVFRQSAKSSLLREKQRGTSQQSTFVFMKSF